MDFWMSWLSIAQCEFISFYIMLYLKIVQCVSLDWWGRFLLAPDWEDSVYQALIV